MKPRQNWLFLVFILVLISLFLAACERPLPGGYNDPYAGPDTSAPDVPVDVPEVDSEGAYPAEEAPAVPGDAADAAQPAEGYPAGEGAFDQGLTAEDQQEPAPDAEQPEPADTETSVETEASSDEEAPAEEGAPSEEGPSSSDEGVAESEGEEAAETPGTHTVASGENLYRIGLLYGISWLDLAEANDITDPASLSVGQVLIIPAAESETITEEAVEGVSGADTAETQPEEAGEPGTYVVQPGDTLNKIGALLGVDWTEIVALNGIVGTQIYAGQVLIVPGPTDTAAETEAAEEETTYVVQEGDSVYSVAFEHGIAWTALVEENDIEAPYTLEVGQALIIPAAE